MKNKAIHLPLVFLLMLLLVLGISCKSESDDSDPTYPAGDSDSTTTDGDQNPSTGENTTGTACVANCEGTDQYCLSLSNAVDCDGYCMAASGQQDGFCLGLCATGTGCPAQTTCLTCADKAEWSGHCVYNDLLPWFNNICNSGSDGDNDAPDGDDPLDGDSDDPVVYGCQTENDCADGEHCDPATNKCATACDPYTRECMGAQVCHVLQEGELAGEGVAICVDQISYGRDEGQLCVGGQLCKHHLICFLNDHCSTVCDPDGENTCPDNKLCHLDDTSGVGVCERCSDFVPCPDGQVCDDGVCETKISCDSYEDCTRPMTCLSNYCQDGCSITGCISGFCNGLTGYCEETCLPACPDGQCCNQGECGPCCDPPCYNRDICIEDVSCAPDATCCFTPEDCREQTDPDAWCEGDLICDNTTGDCRPECPPAGCGWGYVCGMETGYECEPIPPEPCDPLTACSDSACMVCAWLQGQCVPNASGNCPFNCVPTGVGCGTAIGQMACCMGDTCCTDESGMSTCCPSGSCVSGQGCQAR